MDFLSMSSSNPSIRPASDQITNYLENQDPSCLEKIVIKPESKQESESKQEPELDSKPKPE